MSPLNNPVLLVVFAAVFFYVLYGVVRAAVRDGILQADERRKEASAGVSSSGDGARAPAAVSWPSSGQSSLSLCSPTSWRRSASPPTAPKP